MRRAAGYILFESLMAMLILSISISVIQRGMQQAIIVKGQSQDYATAQFLLQELMAELEEQPVLSEGIERGRFRGDVSRFAWEREVRRLDMPKVPSKQGPVRPPAWYMAHLRVTVSWTRRNESYSESLETLLPPERLFVPPPRTNNAR